MAMGQRFVWPAPTHFHQKTKQGTSAVPELGIDINQPTWAAATYRALAENYLPVSRLQCFTQLISRLPGSQSKNIIVQKMGKKSKKDLKANPV
jgi:hypothetical protein